MRLDNFEALNKESMFAMFDMANLQPGEKHVDLGCGEGQFMMEAIKRGATSIGYEIDPALARVAVKNKLNVITGDCFDADVSQADVVTCWFTKLPETQLLMDKLYAEMKPGARFVKCGFTPHQWKPVDRPELTTYTKEDFQLEKVLRVGGEIVCLYIK
jgi:predicted RNA methylase